MPEPLNRWRRGGNQSTQRKPLAMSFRKCHILQPEDSSPKRDSNPRSSIGGRLGKQTRQPLHHFYHRTLIISSPSPTPSSSYSLLQLLSTLSSSSVTCIHTPSKRCLNLKEFNLITILQGVCVCRHHHQTPVCTLSKRCLTFSSLSLCLQASSSSSPSSSSNTCLYTVQEMSYLLITVSVSAGPIIIISIINIIIKHLCALSKRCLTFTEFLLITVSVSVGIIIIISLLPSASLLSLYYPTPVCLHCPRCVLPSEFLFIIVIQGVCACRNHHHQTALLA